jgi:hypothetical protein
VTTRDAVVARGYLLKRRNLPITGTFFLLAVIAFFAGTMRSSGHPWMLMPSMFVMTSAMGLGAWLGRPRRGAATEVRIDDSGVSLGGLLFAARNTIRSAVVSSGYGEVTVHVRRRGLHRGFSLAVDDVATARAMVQALGFDTRSTAIGFQTASRLSESTGAKAAIAALGIGAAVIARLLHTSSFLALFLTVNVLFLIALFTSTRVVIGADGVHLRWLTWKRFVPLTDIERVEQLPARVRLHLRRGVPLAPSVDVFFRGAESRVVPEAMMIAERIREALDRKLEHRGALDPALLARPPGAATRWIAALHGLVREETFREAGVHPRQLWDVVEDATIDVAKRAAAAVALRPLLDDEGRARLRIAARSTAAPRLRIALETAASGDDDEVAAALDELEARRESL